MNTQNYVIAVGVDGSEGSRQALLWAVNEAHARNASVQAINAYHWDFPELRNADTSSRLAKQAEALLASEVESLPAYLLANVAVACEAVEGKPAEALAEAARAANLLVLGSHGHSQQIHKLLGSVTEECVRRATCPVVVIPLNYENRLASSKAGQRVSRS